MQSKLSYVAFAAVFVQPICAGLPCRAQTTEKVRQVGRFYAKADSFSGSVVVVKDGVIVSKSGYGLADRELGVPNTTQTRFAIGSVSKQFIAASILLLQEQGLLKTTDTLALHYAQTPTAWKDVTLRQLLQHTSGIPDGVNVWAAAGKDLGELTPEQIVAAVASKPLLFPPGTRMAYNNMGYDLLGLVIESCSKQTLAEFLQTHFFTPLQMRDSGLASSLQVIPQMAKGYAPQHGGVEVANLPPFSSLFGAGGIYSTGEDIAKWLTALHSGRVLKPASYAEMTKADSDGYGYGLRASQQSGQLDIGHNGRVPGFASETDYFPATKTGIVILSNQLSGSVSPGEAAIETDLMHLATEKDAAIRSLGTKRDISSDLLTRYTGTYSSDQPGIPFVNISWKDGHLTLTPKGRETSTLMPRSDHEFYVKEAEMEVEFVPDSQDGWNLNVFTLPNGTMLALKRVASTPE